jgi:signal peptidase I
MELDLDGLRASAVRRSWGCPGAGLAVLGRPAPAIGAYSASLASLAALAWLTIEPSTMAFWSALALVGLATVLWVFEQIAIHWLAPLPSRPAFLVRGVLPASLVCWTGAALAVFLFFSRCGSLIVAGGGMSPTLEAGERALYEKRVRTDRLRRGSIVLFSLSDRASWGQSGLLMVARILAVPGDRLSIAEGKYLVNGESGPVAVELLGDEPIALRIPNAPQTWTVPEGRYFVAQDSATGAYDSRVFSWVEPGEFVSTRLFHFSLRRFARAVE